MMLDFETMTAFIVAYGMNFIGAIVVLLLGWWIAGTIQRMIQRSFSKRRIDPTLTTFLSSFARYAILLLVFLVILQLIGVQATSLIAVVGAASLAIGLALQGTLGNMAAGVMLLLFRPFRLADDVEVAGKRGIVKDLNLFMTELQAAETGVQVLVPNGQVWNSVIVNHTAYQRSNPSPPMPPAAA